MYIDMYQIENYQIEIPDNTPADEVFDQVLKEWNEGSYTPVDGHTCIGDSSFEASKFLLDNALEIHQHYLEEFCTVLYKKLYDRYNDDVNDVYIASVIYSTIKVECKIGQTLHSKIIKAETIEKALTELKSFFS